jgi:hypothetical protein
MTNSVRKQTFIGAAAGSDEPSHANLAPGFPNHAREVSFAVEGNLNFRVKEDSGRQD